MNHDMSSTPIENSFEFQRSCKKEKERRKKMRSLVLWFGLMRDDDDNKTLTCHMLISLIQVTSVQYMC